MALSCKPISFGLAHEQLHQRLTLIGHLVVENGVFECLLQLPYLTTGLEIEHLHDFIAVDAGLKQPLVVALLQVGQLLPDDTEIIQETLLALLVLARNVGFAKRHQVINVVTGIIEQPTHGAIRHLVVGNGDGTQMELNEFLHILHLGIHGHLHAAEDLGNHLGANEIVVVERPAHNGVETLGTGLADVVEERGPTKPKFMLLVVVVAFSGTADIVKHLQRVIEIVFMRTAVAGLYLVHNRQFGENQLQQSAPLQVNVATAGGLAEHNLVQLAHDTLTADNLDAVGIAG